MKSNISLLFSVLLLSTNVFAQKEKPVSSEIKNVTVFLHGCEITRTAKFNLSEGTTQLVLDNLSSQIEQSSIQVSGKGDFVIEAVTPQMNYLHNADKSSREKQLEDSLKLEKNNLVMLNAQQAVLDEQDKLLTSNEKIGGANTGLSIDELKKAMDYFTSQLMEIKTKTMALTDKQDEANKKIASIQNQLNEIKQKNNQPTGEVLVTVSAKSATQGSLELTYYIANAGWNPSYDIRATNTQDPVALTYKADIWQNTNVDWDNADITLSTGNPMQPGTQPTLNPLYVDFYSPPVFGYEENIPSNAEAPRSQLMERVSTVSTSDEKVATKSQTNASYTAQVSNELSTTFHIQRPFSVPSDAKPHTTEIAVHNINSTYDYYAAPKLDKHAFLIANITDWDQYKLLAGKANIFYKGMYVGKSFINPQNTNDTLKVSLGMDKDIVIERKKVTDFTKEAVIGDHKEASYTYELTVRNSGSNPIQITMEDQVPISMQKKITVKLKDQGDASYNEATGLLRWKLSLKPNDTSKHKFSYSIDYPKDKVIKYQ
ncbi:MAG TPA: mucoidy inhibitor MuiA family protein [Bacteroidia bacterium]|nr:mucoidy inhibitor MuiA family protein [Bacteroidia bacterium]